MNITTKKMLSIIGEQLARIIELNEYVDKADTVLNSGVCFKNVKRKQR